MSKPRDKADVEREIGLSSDLCSRLIAEVAARLPEIQVPGMLITVLAELLGRVCWAAGPERHDYVLGQVKEGAMAYVRALTAQEKLRQS